MTIQRRLISGAYRPRAEEDGIGPPLNFRSSDSPIPTVELNLDDLHDAGFSEGYGTLINHSLGKYANDNKDAIATVYVYSTVSVNGGSPHNAEFFGVVGNRKEKLLDTIKSKFVSAGHRRGRNIWICNSDYVRFDEYQSIFHIEDDRLWKPEDATC